MWITRIILPKEQVPSLRVYRGNFVTPFNVQQAGNDYQEIYQKVLEERFALGDYFHNTASTVGDRDQFFGVDA
ncbi:MAG: hypothetical protein HC866_01795 [Leptolyngbyaceae cyanobacterium RU_5_1]|nr:hypothetical protein [Leptolyngbyaceae cyanobacterium RU_5_1]